MTATLTVTDLSVAYGRVPVVAGVSFTVPAGRVVGLVGPNGAGKTTVLDAISGFAPAGGGRVRLDGVPMDGLAPHERARRGLARTFQSLELFEDLTVAENLAVAGAPDVDAAGRGDVAALRPATLSHDRRARLALDRALAGRPRALLLDEPAAGLDPHARAGLARRLRALAADGLAVVLVDHDMGLVLDVCDDVVVLDAGRVIAHAPPAVVRDDPAVLAAYLGGPAPAPRPAGPAAAAGGTAAGEVALRVDGLSGGYAGVPVVREVSLTVAAGEVVALLGPNGAGKTTLLRTVAGLLPPLAGRVRVLGLPADRGPARLARRGMAVVPQGRGLLTRLTARENLRLAARGRAARGRLEEVLDVFPALRPLLDRPTGALSGGEQQQLALARALLTRPRLLLVDELSLGLAPALVPPLLAALRRAADEHRTAVLLVEQHLPLALGVADRAYVLDRGRITLGGAAAELATRPDLVEASYLGDGRPC